MNRTAKKSSPMQFSIAALLIATLAIASFFGGLMFRDRIDRLEAIGTYTVRFPRGAQRPAKVVHVDEGEYRLQGAGVLNGVYAREGGTLTMLQPNDERMVGLVWRQTEKGWRLTEETPGTPTGSSYVGTELIEK